MTTFLTIWAGAFLLIMALLTAVWLVSVLITDASIVDPFWSLCFVLATWFYYAQADGLPVRQLLITVLVTIWGVRLSLYLFWRNWGEGEDFRYQRFRQKYGPDRYWWVSYFQVFLLQGTLAWLISATLLGAQYVNRLSSGLNLLDFLGVGVWLIGFIFEAGGDWQLARFKSRPENKGKLLTTGFWRYTRHPNYFGDACVWWGYALICLAAGSVIPIFGAGLMTYLLLRVSGVAMLEKSMRKSKEGYEEYMARTSPFFPMPPGKSK